MSAYPRHRQRALKSDLTKLAECRKDGKEHFPGKKRARQLFQIAIDVVAAGKAIKLSNGKGIDARMFLPNVPEGFCKYFKVVEQGRGVSCTPTRRARATDRSTRSAQ